MSCICYTPRRFNANTYSIIVKAQNVLARYMTAGYQPTLRRIYYDFIGRDLLPDDWIDTAYNAKHGLDPNTKNTLKNYKRLGSILNDARLAGELDWVENRLKEGGKKY